MSKLLPLLLVIAVVWWLAKGFRRRQGTRDAPPAAPEQMVSCGYCGLYLPQSEAVSDADKFYCCAEHRRRAG